MAPYSDADKRLESCARVGDGAGVRAALQGGAVHHMPGPNGRLPLHEAAAAGHSDVITALVQAGADLGATSGMARDDGGSALHLAAESGRLEVLRLLANAGAPLDAMDAKGRTAVHWAALRGQKDALVTLHTLGADLHAGDTGQANALHFAAASGSLEAVRWLVEVAGVSLTQLDLNKKSPYDIAKKKGQKHVVTYLKQHGQRPASLRRHPQPQQHHPQQQGPSSWVFSQESPPSRPRSQHDGSIRSSSTQRTYQARPHSQHGSTAWPQSQHQSRPRSQHDVPAWQYNQQNQHVIASRSPSQQSEVTSIYSQQQQHEALARTRSQQEGSAWSYGQQNQHEALARTRSQQEGSAWNYSQQNQSVPRPQGQDGSATWSHGQQRTSSARQSQRETTAWVQSQQEEEPRTALGLLTLQNQDLRKKITDLEKREAEMLQRSAADQMAMAELRREVDRLTGILQSEGRDVDSRQVAAMREEIQHLTFMLDDAGRRALATQEAQQGRIEALRVQEDLSKRRIADLTRRLEVAEESNKAMMAEAQDRERSETYLRGEVDRLQLALASAPKLEAYAELQARANRLTEQDTIHRQAILTMRRQLEAARTPPAQPTTTTDQRKLRELTMEAEKYKEEAAILSARLQEMMSRAAEAEKVASAYKHRFGECDRELREEREASGRTVASLREELAELRGRMDAVRKRAASSLTRTSTLSSSVG